FVILGALKLRLTVSPMFPNFGPDAIADRAGDAAAKVLVTRKNFLRKIEVVRAALPGLRHVLVTDAEGPVPGAAPWKPIFSAAADSFDIPHTDPDDPSILHYTSGSTGKPKGVLHRHGAAAFIARTAAEALGLREGDRYWCTADQGWITGTSYGVIGPWACGATQIHYGGQYDPRAWLAVLEKEEVNVWYTAPTALRMLMKEDRSFFERARLGKLRHICSVGEPLNPEVIRWARRTLGKEIYETWFQTETGAIMVANRPGLEVRPGSMGKAVGGVEAEVLGDDGRPAPAGARGELCLKAGWPSMFTAYLNNGPAYRSKFRDGFYRSGDVAFRDADGFIWFAGRGD
ncbi:MAG TPA: AMP-binding protein, partial [Elusimicrobiales bacterium]|nr:AMP-binding protein [Elusimicrobiales bacterium]